MLKKNLLLSSSSSYKQAEFVFRQTSADISGLEAGLVTFGDAVGVYQYWDSKEENAAFIYGSAEVVDLQPGRFPVRHEVYNETTGQIVDSGIAGSCEMRCFDFASGSRNQSLYTRSDVTYLGLLHQKEREITDLSLNPIATVSAIEFSEYNPLTGFLNEYSYSFGDIDLNGVDLFIDGSYAGTFEKKTFTKDGYTAELIAVFDPLVSFKVGVSQEIRLVIPPNEVSDVVPFVGSVPDYPIWIMNTRASQPIFRGSNGETVDYLSNKASTGKYNYYTKSIPNGVHLAIAGLSPIGRWEGSPASFGPVITWNESDLSKMRYHGMKFYNSIYEEGGKVLFNSHKFQHYGMFIP